MSGMRLRKMPWLIAAVLIVVACAAAAGCGKSSSAAQGATSTSSAQTKSAVPTLAQTIAAGDAVCTTAAKELQSLMAHMHAIRNSGASSEEINKRLGPLVQEIAGVTRGTARTLQELKLPTTNFGALTGFASSLVEIAVIEEQLGQALRGNEASLVRIVANELQSDRAHATEQAKAFGFKVCHASTVTPVA